MAGWMFGQSTFGSGRFRVTATGYGPDGSTVDITVVRGIPTVLGSYSSADPFGDAAAVLTLGGLTLYDDLDSADLRRWLNNFSDIDIYWVPSTPATHATADSDRAVNPITNQPDVQNLFSDGIKVWEGFIASFDFSDQGIELQCQGCVFQLDRYQAKPFFPAQPWPIERLISDQFDHTRRPHLRIRALQTIWPAGWTRVAPIYDGQSPAYYAPVITPGDNWTEYVTRATGSFDAALTGYIQDQLGPMITRPGDGVPPGDQWTINNIAGRQPQMYVRAKLRPADFSVWVGTPGVTVQLSQDSTQAGNIIYGRGSDISGVIWNNNQVSNDGSRTDYVPLAADPAVFPYSSNPLLMPGGFVTEVSAQFESGFSQAQATALAQQWLARDRDAGFTGSVTLSSDPSSTLTRWQVKAGMTMVLKGFLGSGSQGVRLHVSAVTCAPEEGTVELTVDSRYRDLLTVQESINRTRDPLTPVKMLQINKTSLMIPDVQAPWDYSAGAGCVPLPSKDFHRMCPEALAFPYQSFTKKYPPTSHPEFYVKVNANSSDATGQARWAGPISVLTSTKGSISRSEFAMYDKAGNVLPWYFHVSFYQNNNIDYSNMPRDSHGLYSPFIDNGFEETNPATGMPWATTSDMGPPPDLLVGWGSQTMEKMNRAGFSPGSEADGSSPTGLLIDNLVWNYDSSKNLEYAPDLPAGYPQPDGALNIYGMFYAEIPPGSAIPQQAVYFMGRLFHQNAGSDSA